MKLGFFTLMSVLGYSYSSTEFTRCAEFVRKSGERSIPEAVKLKVYGLFKQGTLGNCDPVLAPNSDIYTRTKHRAWCAEGGKSQQMAQSEYVSLIDRLAPEWRKAFEN